MNRLNRTRRRRAEKKRERDERKRAQQRQRRSSILPRLPPSPSAVPPEDVSPLLAHMHSYLPCSELISEKIPVAAILKQIEELEWSSSLLMVACMAAFVANRGGPASQEALEATRFELSRYDGHHRKVLTIVDALKRFDNGTPTRAIIHEQVLLHLAALVILYAGDKGRTASGTELTFWTLVLNDHLDEADAQDSQLSDQEDLVAKVARLGRFNWMHDRVAVFARMQEILKVQPHRGHWHEPDRWEQFKRAAFNMSVEEFMETCLGPLVFLSASWGLKNNDDKIYSPLIDPGKWLEGTARHDSAAARALVQSLTTDREELKGLLKKEPSGLPQLPSAFYLKPLVRLDDDRLVALSPWLLLEQLRVGLWGRLRGAVKASGATSQDWTSTFGDLFERWCGRVATIAATSPEFSGRLVPQLLPGDPSQFEDVIVEGDGYVILFSVKATLVEQTVAKAGASGAKVIQWYTQTLFSEAKKGSREHSSAGPIRQLEEAVLKIRDNKSPFPSEVEIFPVLVTFDELVSHPNVCKWILEQCAERNMLQDDGVRSITLASIDEFEALMALSSNGRPLVELLRKKTGDKETRLMKLDAFLADEVGSNPSLLRMKFLDDEFSSFAERLRRVLWPKPE
jgi:hypothetical protein